MARHPSLDSQAPPEMTYASLGNNLPILVPNSLVETLATRQLEIVNVLGDGNCFFRAVADQLLGTAERHDEVRQQGIRYIDSHREDFREFLLDLDIQQFLDANSEPGTYADHHIVQAVSNAYQVKIEIFDAQAGLNNARFVVVPTIGLDASCCLSPLHPGKRPPTTNQI